MKSAVQMSECVTIKSGGKTYIRGQWWMAWVLANPRVIKAGGSATHAGIAWTW